MSSIGHDVDLRVRQEEPVLLHDLRLHRRVRCTVRDQDRCANRRQQVIVVEDAREQRLTYKRRHRRVEPSIV